MLNKRSLLTIAVASMAASAVAQDRRLNEAFTSVAMEIRPAGPNGWVGDSKGTIAENTPVEVIAYLQNYEGPVKSRSGLMRVRIRSQQTGAYIGGAATPSTRPLPSLGQRREIRTFDLYHR